MDALFVDGENFAKRGCDFLKKAGHPPSPGPRWRRDVFLWTPSGNARWRAITGDSFMPWDGSSLPRAGDLRRAYYYTSTESDDPEWTEIRQHIRALDFEPHLFPRKKGRPSKEVDVAMTSAVLTLGAAGQYEVAVLIAGDRDYVPLVEAVKQLGRHVGVGFVESGLSPELQIAADEYVDLGTALVGEWKSWHERQASEANRTADDQPE